MEKALVKLKQTAVVKQVAAGREFTVMAAIVIVNFIACLSITREQPS